MLVLTKFLKSLLPNCNHEFFWIISDRFPLFSPSNHVKSSKSKSKSRLILFNTHFICCEDMLRAYSVLEPDTKSEAGLPISIDDHRHKNHPKFQIPSSKSSRDNPNAQKAHREEISLNVQKKKKKKKKKRVPITTAFFKITNKFRTFQLKYLYSSAFTNNNQLLTYLLIWVNWFWTGPKWLLMTNQLLPSTVLTTFTRFNYIFYLIISNDDWFSRN